MTEQAIIRACAELDGWEPIPEGHYHPDNPVGQNTPPYTTSYDAIIPLIQRLAFQTVLFETFWTTATPLQLCEALLRATGKWKE